MLCIRVSYAGIQCRLLPVKTKQSFKQTMQKAQAIKKANQTTEKFRVHLSAENENSQSFSDYWGQWEKSISCFRCKKRERLVTNSKFKTLQCFCSEKNRPRGQSLLIETKERNKKKL